MVTIDLGVLVLSIGPSGCSVSAACSVTVLRAGVGHRPLGADPHGGVARLRRGGGGGGGRGAAGSGGARAAGARPAPAARARRPPLRRLVCAALSFFLLLLSISFASVFICMFICNRPL